MSFFFFRVAVFLTRSLNFLCKQIYRTLQRALLCILLSCSYGCTTFVIGDYPPQLYYNNQPMIYEPRRSFLRSVSVHVPIQPSMRCLSVDINQTQNPASVQAMSISQKSVCGYLISIYFPAIPWRSEHAHTFRRRKKSGAPAGNTWTATIAPGGPTGLRPVCVFFCMRAWKKN